MTTSAGSAVAGPSLRTLRAMPLQEQERLGCADTLRELLQQPDTWENTATLLEREDTADRLRAIVASKPAHIVLTGSGSSCFVGESLAPLLQACLGIPSHAVSAGALLTDQLGVLPKGSGLLISIARSGDSPESTAVVDQVLADCPDYRHLVLTCNAAGALATRYTHEPRLQVLLLDERTNDRSLVMTSSFTNLLMSGTGLLTASRTDPARAAANAAAALCRLMFDRYGNELSEWARLDFDTVVYLGSVGAFGAARESALKMLEMSGGSVGVLTETFLGLRHGPMSRLNHPGLLVAFLSPEPTVRAYESDLLRELSLKHLGLARIVVGENVSAELVGSQGLAIELPGLYRLPHVYSWMLQTVVGQLLALFRCLHLGYRPDAPSQGVLTRVVGEFAIHRARRAA